MYSNPRAVILENVPNILAEIYQSILNSHTGDTYPYSKMSKQHIGDSPPGDDDYYNPVDEESNRATGSGFNPNAAAWDPEKMEFIGSRGWRRGELCLPGQGSRLSPTR